MVFFQTLYLKRCPNLSPHISNILADQYTLKYMHYDHVLYDLIALVLNEISNDIPFYEEFFPDIFQRVYFFINSESLSEPSPDFYFFDFNKVFNLTLK